MSIEEESSSSSLAAREAVLSLLSVMERDIDASSESDINHEETLSQMDMDGKVTHMDMNTKLKLKSYCDDISLHLEILLQSETNLMTLSNNEDDESNDLNSKTPSTKSFKSTHEKPAITLRMALGSFQNTPMDKLASTLALLMSDRIDRFSLLPVTQDEQDALEILTSTNVALTLSKLSLSAAKVYANMIGIRGAWSAGLIDVGAMSSLSALIKRWSEECRGREKISNMVDDHESIVVPSTQNRNTKRRQNMTQRGNKKRRKVSLDSEDDGVFCNDDEEAEGNSQVLEDDAGSGLMLSFGVNNAAYDLVKSGMELGLLLSDSFTLEEFRNWSTDARDSFVESVVTCLATVAALTPTIVDDKASDKKIAKLTRDVVRKLRSAIVSYMSSSYYESTSDGKALSRAVIRSPPSQVRSSQGHEEGTLSILRALYPYLTLQSSLPNGVKGKICAFDTAKSLLEDTLQKIAQQKEGCLNMNSKYYSSLLNVPLTQTPTKSHPKTPASSSFSRYPTLLKTDFTPKSSRKALPIEQSKDILSINDQPRTFYSVLLGMMQKIITSSLLIKTDARERALGCIISWLHSMPAAQKTQFITFANQMCRSKLTCHRLVGCEIVGRSLSSTWFWKLIDASYVSENIGINMTPDSPLHQQPSSVALNACALISSIEALSGRLLDRVPIVRARAAYSITNVFSYLVNDTTSGALQDNAVRVIISHCPDLFSNLSARVCMDDRATVRKAAIVAYSTIFHFLLIFSTNNIFANREDTTIFIRACSDVSVSVRKAAVEGMTTLLTVLIKELSETHPLEDSFANIWVENVFPLITDVENSCASQVVASFITLIFEPIIQFDNQHMAMTDNQKKNIYMSSWALLSKVVECSFKPGSTRSGTRALHYAIEKSLETFGASSSTVLKTLLNRLHSTALSALRLDQSEDSENEPIQCTDSICHGTWCMLEAIFESNTITIKESQTNTLFLLSAWKTMYAHYCVKNDLSLLASLRSCLKILSRVIPFSKESDMNATASSLKDTLSRFTLCPILIGAVISTLSAIGDKQRLAATSQIARNDSDNWIRDLYEKCESILEQFASRHDVESDCVRNVIFTVGELSLVGFSNDECSDTHKNNSDLRRLYVRPSTKIITLVQASLLPFRVRCQSSLENADIRTDETVRAHAFVTLGKLCIRDERLARESVDVFAQELGGNSDHSSVTIQNNALMVMGDLCIKYTHLVSKFLPIISSCLQFGRNSNGIVSDRANDDSGLVRRQAVLLLSSLILQGYIKLRGALFYRFLIAAVDDNLGVSNLATLTICGPLQTKYPRLFYNNFVESLFVLNSCKSHPMHAAGISDDQGDMASRSLEYLAGDEFKTKRMDIYFLLLSNMSQEDKIGITARLAKEILAAATESQGELAYFCQQQIISYSTMREKKLFEERERAGSVISDCFTILTSPCLRIARSSRQMIDEDDLDSSQCASVNGPTSAQLNAVKGRLLTKISRKQLIETVLPILCRLKSILETSKSPLLKGLMQYMVCIFRQFRAEVRDVLAAEPTLLQELEYDTKRFEKENTFAEPTDEEGDQT